MSAVGHLATAQTAPQDERLRRRRERFGPAADIDKSDAQKQAGSQPVDACAERRRQKFGPVSAKEDKVDRISDASTLQNEQSLKRRGSKFGTSSIQTDVGVVSGSAATSSSRIVVSPEEIERRLKRQRRFQNVATP